MADCQAHEMTSEEIIEVKCGLCSPDLCIKAHGFCTDCSELLCEGCFKVHLRIPACRQHQLIEDLTRASDGTLVRRNDICTETCSIHNGRVIEFYCEVHSFFGCSHCIIKQHRECKRLVCVVEVVDGIFDSQEFKDLKTNLDTVDSKNNSNHSALTDISSMVDSSFQQTEKDSKEFIDRLKEFIANLENSLIRDIGEKKENETIRLNVVSNDCQKIKLKIGSLNNKIKDMQSDGQKCNAFIAMKNGNDDVMRLNVEEVRLNQEKSVRKYMFNPNTTIKKIMDTENDLGKFSVNSVEHQEGGSVTFKVNNISKFNGSRMSKVTRIHGLPWQLVVRRSGTHLGVVLQCITPPSYGEWSCMATAELEIKQRKYTKEIKRVFKNDCNEIGYPDFIDLQTCLNPSNYYCVDDNIIFEARIIANKPNGL